MKHIMDLTSRMHAFQIHNLEEDLCSLLYLMNNMIIMAVCVNILPQIAEGTTCIVCSKIIYSIWMKKAHGSTQK